MKISLNKTQEKVVYSSSDKVIRCQACAGSGKTTTICCKIQYMINELSYCPCEFLVISFSRSAVAELKHRLQRMIGNKSKEITVSTFHALSYHSIEEKLQVSNNYDLEEYQYLYLKELERSQTSPYRYIFVDEYQDINQIQHDIVMVLSKYSKQLMVVGDLAQNIYKFRHSDHRYLRDFHSFVGDKCTDIRLDINYRSNQGLVEASKYRYYSRK